MQSRSPTQSQNRLTEQQTPNHAPPRQYGLCNDGAAVSLSSTAAVGTGKATETFEDPNAADTTSYTLAREGSVVTRPERRLSTPGTPSPPPGYNRIIEYEKASTPPTWKASGPEFEVIKKSRSATDTSSPIQDLPNGWYHPNAQ